jgi:hypothetical protein
MDDQFELSAFEYVELVERYKDKKEDEPIPTEEEIQAIERMVEDYYASKEFREYVENYQNEHIDDYVDSLTNEQIDEAIAEHNFDEDGWTEEMEKRYWEEQPPYPFATDIEIEAINESNKVKYTDNDILYVLDGLVEPAKMDIIKDKLNGVWNNKNGVF